MLLFFHVIIALVPPFRYIHICLANYSQRSLINKHTLLCSVSKPRADGGNPVTGQGYQRGGGNGGGDNHHHTTAAPLNGAKQVINKNRIPPGGFSSGLW